MILQTWNLTKFHSDSHERLNRGSEGFKARRSGYLSLDWERGIEVNKWSYLITRSWMSTARASSMWWPWRGLLKSSPNRLFFRWAAPRKCGFGTIYVNSLHQVNVKSNFLAFKEANNFSSDRKKDQDQGENSNSLSPAMANMSLQPGLPVPGGGPPTFVVYKQMIIIWPFR